MINLFDIFRALPQNEFFICSPTKSFKRNDILASVQLMRNDLPELQDSIIGEEDEIIAITKMIALDGLSSRLFLVPRGSPQELHSKVRTHMKLANGQAERPTRWIMSTSGTTENPKLVSHTLSSLTRSVKTDQNHGAGLRWALFYDPCRFAGLQVVLQALIGGSSLLVPSTTDLEFSISFLLNEGCTSISATPSMWRKILMTTNTDRLALKHVTLGGEVADAKTLERLRKMFPKALITHIYASTEAGVGFSVRDGKSGFPISFLENIPGTSAQIKIRENNLLIKTPGINQNYFEDSSLPIDKDGYMDTGDTVIVKNNRVYFTGRVNGSINVGGHKVMPEEVENVLLEIPGISAAYVYGKSSSILGSIVAANILAEEKVNLDELRLLIMRECAESLETYKRPLVIKFIETIELTSAGKLKRTSDEQ